MNNTSAKYIHPLELVAITDTWLNDEVIDQLISINEYNIFRNDRSYLARSWKRSLWVHVGLVIRPYRLPTQLSGLIYCVLYNPTVTPLQEQMDLIVSYIIDIILLTLLIRIVELSFSATLIMYIFAIYYLTTLLNR